MKSPNLIFLISTCCSQLNISLKDFLEKINKCHPNIKFTIEKSTETLPFLDVEIKLNENSFDSWVWRKKTHTGVLLNFTAITPLKWKFGLIVEESLGYLLYNGVFSARS